MNKFSFSLAIGSRIQLGSNSGVPTTEVVAIPAGFLHPMLPGLEIEMTGGQAVIKNYTIDDFRRVVATPVVKYLDSVNGVDTNDGNTALTAYKTLAKLYTAGTYDTVYLAAGNYGNTSGSILSLNHEVISVGGMSYISKGTIGNSVTWTSMGSGTFSAPMTQVILNVFNSATLDADGIPIRLTNVASAELVLTTANSWFRDSGANQIHIHQTDGLHPSAGLHMSTGKQTVGAGVTIYAENLCIWGLTLNSNETATPSVFLAKECKFSHVYVNDNAVTIIGNHKTWFEDCDASNATYDCFNYHGTGAYSPSSVEINCNAKNGGIGQSTSSFNGSTTHESSIVLRLNCNYSNTEGPLYHEVHSAKSFNVNCVAGESTAAIAGNKSAFAVATASGETATMWLYRCTGGSATTFGAENRATNTAHIYAKNCTISNVEAGTTVETY